MIQWPDPAALARLDAVLADVRGKRVGVLGLGVVGSAMGEHLARAGAVVVGADLRRDFDGAALTALGVELRLGPMDEATFADVAALAIGPGANPAQPAIQAALRRGVPVCGELELCGPLPARTACITGTNGKSTTTALLGALVAGAGQRTFVGGNLGDPVIRWLDRGEPTDVAVLELSSFQLETAYRFRADVAIVLNVTPDHTDRYPDHEAYARTKQRLVEAVPPDGVAVLSWDDTRVRAMADACRGRVWWLSTAAASVPGSGAVLRGDTAVPSGAAAPLGEIDLRHPRLVGRHNRENALAAWLAVEALGLHRGHADEVLAAYRGFGGLAHRLEHAGDLEGVGYIDDSKATNDDSSATALRAMTAPVVLLLGGRDKGGGYAKLVAAGRGKVRCVIAFGEAGRIIADAVGELGEVRLVPKLRDAFDLARRTARRGDVVLLSPACSSFDEFRDYKDRGDTFKQWVAEAGASARAGGGA